MVVIVFVAAEVVADGEIVTRGHPQPKLSAVSTSDGPVTDCLMFPNSSVKSVPTLLTTP